MHWTCSSFNTFKETRQKPSIHALMGFSLPKIGWCGSFTLQRARLGFGDGGGDEEGGGLAVQTTGLSYVRLFIYRPIFPLHALTNSLSSVGDSLTLYGIQTHTQACTHHHSYINWFTEKMRLTKDRNTPDLGISAVLASTMLIPILFITLNLF